MPLDAHEEAQFRQITEHLLVDDPAFGTDRRWSRSWSAAGPAAAGAALLLALASLPLALWSGLWPIGLAGYVVATFAGARLAHALRPRLTGAATRVAPTHVEDPTAEAATAPRTAAARASLAWASGLAVVAVLAAALIAPGADATADGDPPPAPAASASEDAASQAPPFVRRAPGRSATVTDAATP